MERDRLAAERGRDDCEESLWNTRHRKRFRRDKARQSSQPADRIDSVLIGHQRKTRWRGIRNEIETARRCLTLTNITARGARSANLENIGYALEELSQVLFEPPAVKKYCSNRFPQIGSRVSIN